MTTFATDDNASYYERTQASGQHRWLVLLWAKSTTDLIEFDALWVVGSGRRRGRGAGGGKCSRKCLDVEAEASAYVGRVGAHKA